MILNVLSDDLKFVDLAIDLFEKTEYSFEHIILTNEVNLNLSIVKNANKVRVININTEFYSNYVLSLKDKEIKGVLFNSLIRYPLLKFLYDIGENNKFKISAAIFGAEFYGGITPISNYLGSITKRLYYKDNLLRVFASLKRLFSDKYDIRRLIYRPDFLMVYMQESADLYNTMLSKSMPFLWLTYYPLEDLIGEEFLNTTASENGNILIGNSGNYTSNHIETFLKLEPFFDGNRDVVVPLSYGSDKYIKSVLKVGKEIFAEKFVPLTTFMERSAYNQIIKSCSVVLMNHYRQQAMGNILTSIWLGAKVFLNSNTSGYKYLKNNGISIYDIELMNATIFQSIEPNETIARNRNLLMDMLSTQNSIKKLNESFRVLVNG
jgi:hypothetical protein